MIHHRSIPNKNYCYFIFEIKDNMNSLHLKKDSECCLVQYYFKIYNNFALCLVVFFFRKILGKMKNFHIKVPITCKKIVEIILFIVKLTMI